MKYRRGFHNISEEEMKLLMDDEYAHLNIDIRKNNFADEALNDTFISLANTPGNHKYSGKTLAYVSNGVLGRFHIKYDGYLCVRENGLISWKGYLWIDEECEENYDFDPTWDYNPTQGNGRKKGAEINVRFMYICFEQFSIKITSEKIETEYCW